LASVQVVPATQVVLPVYPVPPHWPYFATVVPPVVLVPVDAGAVVVLEPEPGPVLVELSLPETKVSAAWPYSVP